MPGHPGLKRSFTPESQDAAVAGLAVYLFVVIVVSVREATTGTTRLLLSSALQLLFAVGVAWVFTRWRSAERRCREQTDSVLAVPKVAILTTDPAGFITTWNAGAESIFGYTAEEAIGLNVGVLYSPADEVEGTWRVSLHDAETRGIADENNWRRRKDGSRFWANMLVSATLDDEGHASKYIIMARDFTTWKIGVDHVLDQCTKLEDIVDGTFQIISLKNAILQYEFINAAGALHFGSTPGEIAGKTDSDIMPATLAQASIAHDDKVLRTGTPLTVIEEHEIGASKRRYLTHRSPWRNASGKAQGVITIATDITDRTDFTVKSPRSTRKQAVRQTMFDGEPPVSIQ